MTTDELKQAFEQHDDEFLEFDRIEKPAHRRPDVCAFIMLDAAVEKEDRPEAHHDMVSGAEHDEIYLATTPDDLAAVATDDLIRDLVRCGVRYDTSVDSLAMFT